MSVWAQAWGLAPVVVFVCMVFAGRAVGRSWADALLRAATWWAAGVWVVSNGLSVFDVLRPEVLRAGWAIAAAVAIFRTVRGELPRRQVRGLALTGLEWALVAGVAGLTGIALVTAVLAPPATVDVLNYHGPRQLMWLQQGSLAHFLTVNDRQLMMPPLAEVIGAQFLAITGGDRWANLPQWFAYALLPVAAGSVVRILGGGRTQALLAAWLVACLPMAYAEASNAKNDLQGAFWIVLLLREVALARGPGATWERGTAVRVGVVLGLAVLTKSTAFLYAPPLLMAGVLAWAGMERRLVWRRVLVGVLAALLLSAPFFWRNVAWYGTPLGEHRAEDGGHQQNEAWTPAIFVSNASRGATQHLAGPNEVWNAFLKRTVSRMHEGLGVSVDDKRSTCWGSVYDVVYTPGEETQAGAPWHFVLMVLVVPAVFFRKKTRDIRWLAWVALAMAVLYCVVLKWQPWAPRLQQPVFVTGVVLAVLAVGACGARVRRVACVVLALGGAIAWWPGRDLAARPLLSSPSIFTTDRETLAYRYLPLLRLRDEALLRIVRESGARDVAIWSVHDIPFLLMQKMRRELPDVRFYGAPMSDAKNKPDAIIQMGLLRPAGLYHEMGDGSRYRLVGDFAGDGIYLPEELVASRAWHERLPAFAGWIKHEGLRFHEETLPVIGSRQILRELDTKGAVVEFRSATDAVRVLAIVAKSDGGKYSLKLGLEGGQVAEVALPDEAGVYAFEHLVPCRPGLNRLRLDYTGTEAPINFLRLQLNDAPAE